MKHYEIEQNSEEWLQMRAGKITSSNLNIIMANFGKAFGEPAKKYAVQIAVEQLTEKYIPSPYSNQNMDEGHVKEPIARALYETETFTTVLPGGFFCNDSLGCSPDGLIGDSGVIEIKSVISGPHTHYDRIRRQSYDPAHLWQCLGNLKFTGREWLDFVSYCDMFPDGKQLYIYRFHAEKFSAEFQKIDQRIDEFRSLIEETKSTILNANYSI